MAILDFFKQAQQPQQQQQQQQQAPATPSAGQAPTNASTTQGTNSQPNPLDVYTKLFDNATTSQAELPPSFSLPDKTLNEVSSSLDFTQSIPPELMQKALGGDVQSLMQAMNIVGQQAYKTSLHHTTSLTDKYVGARSAYDLKNVNSRVKTELTQQELANIPNYSHPVAKAELNKIADQMARANPDAPPAEIAKAAQQYLNDLVQSINPTPKKEAKSEEVDWSSYLG